MKKIKKIVLSVLLLTFAFISVHDYALPSVKSDTAYEQVHLECEGSIVDLASHLHDSVHSLLLNPLQEISLIAPISPYQKQLESKNLFISHIGSVAQRPPLS